VRKREIRGREERENGNSDRFALKSSVFQHDEIAQITAAATSTYRIEQVDQQKLDDE
jgi:hypothetical protein